MQINNNLQSKKTGVFILFIVFISFFLNFHCSTNYKKALKALPEHDKDFVFYVQYLLTNKEKKIFVNLNEADRANFIKEFWKKRDPTPDTVENEYRETYFERINKANALFKSGGKQGWLSDRGRTYILFGPPERRDVYPMGYSFYEPPVEVWYYGMFPVIFVDEYRDGDYRIVYSSYQYLQQITRVEMVLHPNYKVWDRKLVGKMKLKRGEDGGYFVEADIPYKLIVFDKKDSKYIGTLILKFETLEKDKKKRTRFEKKIEIITTNEELKTLPDAYKIKEVVELKNGKYRLRVSITDKKSGKGIYKVFNIKI